MVCGLPAAAPAQVPASIPAPIDADAVLDAVYGGRREGRWNWTVPADAPIGPGQDLRGHEVEVRPLMSAHFVQEGHERFLVVTGVIDPQYNCHGCSTLIGAALYTLDGGEAIWQPGPVAAALDLTGSFGLPPEVSFEQPGPHIFGFSTTYKWAGTGETDDWFTLWRAGPGGFAQVLSLNRRMTGLTMSHPVVWDCEVVRHDIHVLPTARDGLFDLVLLISAGTLHAASDTVDACELPLTTAADLRQLETIIWYDSAMGRYCQRDTLQGVPPQSPLCPP